MKTFGVVAVCLVMFLALPSAASAQDVSIGAKVGGGFSWMAGSDWRDALDSIDGDSKTRFGFTVAAFVDLRVAPGLYVQPGIAYSRMGGAHDYFESTVLFEDVDGKITASAFEIPVLLALQGPAGSGAIRVFAGPDLVLILGDIEYEEKAAGLKVSTDAEPDNSLALAIKAGIGYVHPVGAGAFVLDLSYARTLTEIFEDDNTAVSSLLVAVGYQVGL